MITSLADLMRAGALRTGTVDVCGVTVCVRELAAGHRARVIKAVKDAPQDLTQLMVLLCAVDEAGVPLFTEATADQIGLLRPELVDGIAAKAMELSGLGEKPGKD